jgi:predicted dehydrogenase
MQMNDRIGVGVIGLGVMGAPFARILAGLPGVDLVGVADVAEQRANAIADELGCQAYASAASLLRASALEAVVVATPDAHHREPAVACLNAGKHVLVEKPLATSVADAAAIVEAAERHERVLRIAHVLRFDPAYQRARTAVAAGELGQLTHVFARRSTSASDAERLAGRVSVVAYLGIHDIDALMWVVGSPIVSARAVAVRRGMAAPDLDDAVVSTLRFANGAIGTLECSWLRPDGPAGVIGARMDVAGCDGVVEVTPYAPTVSVYRAGTVESETPAYALDRGAHGQIAGIYRDEVLSFLAKVRGGDDAGATGLEGLAAVRVVEAIERSLRDGDEVSIADGAVA